jgi:hypothetical protein
MESSDEGSPTAGVALNLESGLIVKTLVVGLGWVNLRWRGKAWRRVGYEANILHQNQRFFKFNYSTVAGVSLDPGQTVRLGTTVETSNNKTIHDLGGIVDFGTIAYGSCKTYDDGVWKN